MTTRKEALITSKQTDAVVILATQAVKNAIRKVSPSKDGTQTGILGDGAEFKTRLEEASMMIIADLTISNKYESEEVTSTYGYLSGYREGDDFTLFENIADLEKELVTLKKLFPELRKLDVDRKYLARIASGEVTPPNGVAGRWTLVVPWNLVADTYGAAVERAMELLNKDRKGKFENLRAGQLGADQLKKSARSTSMFDEVSTSQEGEIKIVWMQFGLRHAGRSIRRAREVFRVDEFGVGWFEALVAVLLHADRLRHYDDLWIDCPGDEFKDSPSDESFDLAPFLVFLDGKVWAGTLSVSHVYAGYGSASFFLPQES